MEEGIQVGMTKHNLSSTVTVIGKDDSRAGMGFFIDATLVCTCAHVVSEALQLTEDGPEPALGAMVALQLHSGSSTTATIEKWFRRLENGTEGSEGVHDVAILKLTSDIDATGNVPRFRESCADLTTSAYSNAHGHPRWSYNKTSPSSRGLVQLDVLESSGMAIVQGFSGAPVWDDSTGAIVGMINSRISGSKIGYMMCIQSLAEHCGFACHVKTATDLTFEIRQPDIYEQLIEILNSGTWPECIFLDAYEQSVPMNSAKHTVIGTQPDASPLPMVAALRRMCRGKDDTHPILSFVWRLIVLSDLSASNSSSVFRLEKWFDEAASKSQFRCDARALQAMKERISDETLEPKVLHLVFLLCESGESEYEVSVYRVLVSKNKKYWNELDPRLMQSAGRVVSLETLRSMVSAILEGPDLAIDLLRAEDNMIIELIVPDDLLVDHAWCPDQWSPRIAGSGRPIGAKWHVLLRSWSRAYSPGSHFNYGDWRRQWAKSEPRLGVVLRSVPSRQPNGTYHPPELDTVISGEADASVAIWPRQDLHKTPNLAIELDDIEATRVDDWFDEVRRRRKAASAKIAAGSERILGRCMTLYWDDPNKLLPTAFGRGRGCEMDRSGGSQ